MMRLWWQLREGCRLGCSDCPRGGQELVFSWGEPQESHGPEVAQPAPSSDTAPEKPAWLRREVADQRRLARGQTAARLGRSGKELPQPIQIQGLDQIGGTSPLGLGA
jgi:hypothetical protein